MQLVIDGATLRDAPDGGMYRYLLALVSYLRRMDEIELSVLTPPGYKLPVEGAGPAALDIPQFSWVPGRSLRRFLAPVKRKLQERIWRNHVRPSASTIFHSIAYEKPMKGTISVVTAHDLIFEKFRSFFQGEAWDRERSRIIQSVRNAERCIAISQTTKDDLCSILSLDPSRIDVAHHGVHTSQFFPSEAGAADARAKFQLDVPYILYVGGRPNHKNFALVLEAFSQSTLSQDYFLVVVGRNWTEQEAQEISRRGMESKLRLIERPSEPDLINLYRAAAVFVFPSLYEGFGFPVLESMACGTLLAASNAGPVPEIGGEVPAYFDPREPGELVSAVRRLEDRSTAENRRKLGLERVKEFSWEKTSQLTVECYRKALANH